MRLRGSPTAREFEEEKEKVRAKKGLLLAKPSIFKGDVFSRVN
jgi:hypothetical protein